MRRPDVSVVICTYNPAPHRLDATVAAIALQSMSADDFEVIIVDNASVPSVEPRWGLENLRIAKEPRQGLTYARIRGVHEAKAPLIVFVDDDNVLSADYLVTIRETFSDEPSLGALGGPIQPRWEGDPPESWTHEFFDLLAIRDLGTLPLRAGLGAPPTYPESAPVGAGMAVRRAALTNWLDAVARGSGVTDRTGASLTSGGDNDIVLHILAAGWIVGYDPSLTMQHIIPAGRLEVAYLGRLSEAIMMSWIETLDHHGIRPWAAAHPAFKNLKLARLFFVAQPWRSRAHYVRWKARRGAIIGRSTLTSRSFRFLNTHVVVTK